MEYNKVNRLIKFNGEKLEYDADNNMTYGSLNGVMTQFTYDCCSHLNLIDPFGLSSQLSWGCNRTQCS